MKIYFQEQIKKAKKQNLIAKKMVKKQRITKQVRLEISIYKRIKIIAKENNKTMSKTLDKIIKNGIKVTY